MTGGWAAAAAVDPRGTRLRLLGGLFACAFLVIAVRLGELSLLGDRGAPAAPSVLAGATPAAADGHVGAASRADIVDRNGALLATTLYTVSLIADPQQVQDPEEAAARLAEVLPGTRREALHAGLVRPGRYALLKRALTPEEQQAVNDLGLPGIGFEPVEHRVYPQRELAAHVVGAVNAANEGTWGAERFFDAPLRQETAAGRPLVLSLDLRVQQVLRTELAAAVERFRAKGGNGVVLDARTGEVLAMVSLPDFDPNWAAGAKPERLMDRNTRGTYEVGSVFKVFTAAAALETGAAALTDRFDASEPLRLGRHRVRDYRGHERWLSVPEVIVFSSNIGAARMAQAVGPEGMHAFLGRLGLLARQGIELSGAAAPQPPPKWDLTYISTIAFGHGIAVTPLHVAAAMATVVNDGWRVAPTLLRRAPERAAAVEPERVLSAEVSDQLRWLLWLNGLEGTGRSAQVAGYMVGGKSASAEKPKGGRYDRNALLSSFTAVFPSHAPRYVVLAMLDEPHGDADTRFEATGGWTAAPVVRRVIERLGPLLGVPPVALADEMAYRARLRVGRAVNGRTKREERSFEAVGPGV